MPKCNFCEDKKEHVKTICEDCSVNLFKQRMESREHLKIAYRIMDHLIVKVSCVGCALKNCDKSAPDCLKAHLNLVMEEARRGEEAAEAAKLKAEQEQEEEEPKDD